MNHDEALAALVNARTWRKSSHSQRANGCVETTTDVAGWIGVRDSKLGPKSPVLAFTPREWRMFVKSVLDGQLDD